MNIEVWYEDDFGEHCLDLTYSVSKYRPATLTEPEEPCEIEIIKITDEDGMNRLSEFKDLCIEHALEYEEENR